MSNKSDKKKEAELKAQSAQLNAEAVGDRRGAREEGAVSQQMSGESLGWFNLLKDPNRDFSKVLPITSMLAEEGEAGADEERTARGAYQFGAAGADPNLQAVLKANETQRRAIRRGKSLEGAVSRYDTIMRAQAGDLVAQDNARRMGAAGLTTSAGANALNNYAAFQPRPHWGLSLASGLLGAAGQVAGASMGRPPVPGGNFGGGGAGGRW